jgi:hypothetical protein
LLEDQPHNYVYLKDINNSDFQNNLQRAFWLTASDFSLTNESNDYQLFAKSSEKYTLFINSSLAPSINNTISLNGKKLIFTNVANEVYKTKIGLIEGINEIKLASTFLNTKNYFTQGNFEKDINGWEKTNSGLAYGQEKGTIVIQNEKLLLTANNQNLVARYKIINLPKNQQFRLSFDFKNINSLPLQVGIWQDQPQGEFLVNPEAKNYFSQDIKHQQIIFSSKSADSLYIYFYALVDTFNLHNEILIDNIKIEDDHGLRSLVILPEATPEENVSYYKIENGHYKINLTVKKPGWLIFNSCFNKWWQAEAGGRNLPHQMINSFANGYYFDKSGSYTIDIVYYPQKLFIWGKNIFFIFLLIYILILGYQRINKIIKL